MGIYDNGTVTEQASQNETMKQKAAAFDKISQQAERKAIADREAQAWSQKYHNDMGSLAQQFAARENQRMAELNTNMGYDRPLVEQQAEMVDPEAYRRLERLQELEGSVGAPAEQGLASQLGGI